MFDKFFNQQKSDQQNQTKIQYKVPGQIISKKDIMNNSKQMDQYIDTPSELLKQIWRDPNVHLFQKEVHIIEKKKKIGQYTFSLIDYSLKAHGKDEDQQYINSLFYRSNIRRGNTFIQYKNGIQWARKGTPKIMDIQLKYLHSYSKGITLTKNQTKIRDIIFHDVIASLQRNNKIQVIKTQKADGENAQISYNYSVNGWVICSKNVSILAHYRQDLGSYKQQRYQYALMIAQEWFKILDKLKKDQILKLKQKLDGFTIVGEYCGNQQYQHLIKYDRVQLRWFAIIKNDSENYCWDPFQFKKQFHEFGLEFVRVKVMGTFSKFDKCIGCIQQLFKKTSQSDIEDKQYGEQGSILYFVELGMKDKKPISKSVGAAKLKTLQYRFLRKIREKMKRFNINKQNGVQAFKKYENQCLQLQNQCESRAPHPFDHYKVIIQTAFDLMKVTKISNQFISGKFVTLLKLIYYVIFKKISLQKYSKSMIKDESFLKQVNQLSFKSFGSLNCNTNVIYFIHGLPGMFKSYLGKKIAVHFQKLEIYYQIIEINNVNQYNVEQNSKKITIDVNKVIQNQKKLKDNKRLKIYYVDGYFDPSSFNIMIDLIKSQTHRSIDHQFKVIKNKNHQIFRQGSNQYPFDLEYIIFCYYGQHQKKIKAPKISEKVQNLRLVTSALKANVNCEEFKQPINVLEFPFTQNVDIPNIKEFSQILSEILESDNQKSYHKLILRLQEIQNIKYLTEQQLNQAIQNAIKNSFSFVPTIKFNLNKNENGYH